MRIWDKDIKEPSTQDFGNVFKKKTVAPVGEMQYVADHDAENQISFAWNALSATDVDDVAAQHVAEILHPFYHRAFPTNWNPVGTKVERKIATKRNVRYSAS